MASAGFTIAPASGGADLDAVGTLFRAYAASLEIDLGYQGFAAELAGLPGAYAPPQGALLLARDEAGAAIGCVAMRPFEAGICELKRLYVAPSGRNRGLGRALAEAILHAAIAAGYREARLDTLPSMASALALYGALGFEPTERYYDTPLARTVFMRRSLP